MSNPQPSYFASKGHPSCSRWGKVETETLAQLYVGVLAEDGDTWKPMTIAYFTEKAEMYGMASDGSFESSVLHSLQHPHGQARWKSVAGQLQDAEGAFGVGGAWSDRRRWRTL